GDNSWLTVSLREGKNREIRRVMEGLNLHVSRLIRLSYGPFQLGSLKARELEEVPGKTLREQVPDLPAPKRHRTR
ncbi:MAG: pseudouridine synthase, partial [Gluconobacter oxydans]